MPTTTVTTPPSYANSHTYPYGPIGPLGPIQTSSPSAPTGPTDPSGSTNANSLSFGAYQSYLTRVAGFNQTLQNASYDAARKDPSAVQYADDAYSHATA